MAGDAKAGSTPGQDYSILIWVFDFHPGIALGINNKGSLASADHK
jgi:hypothetical protein